MLDWLIDLQKYTYIAMLLSARLARKTREYIDIKNVRDISDKPQVELVVFWSMIELDGDPDMRRYLLEERLNFKMRTFSKIPQTLYNKVSFVNIILQ